MTVARDEPASAAAAPSKVLVVDDNDDLRRWFRRVLVRDGHEVVEASNGAEARTLVREHRFDLVVSDVRMPDMGGVELLRLLHESDPDLPVLLISADPDLDSALKAVEFGAFEYLTKPVGREKFTTSVGRALARRRQQLATRQADSIRSGERACATSESLTGTLLGGRYRIGTLLGVGGMGSVYEATREDLARMPVAIKVIHSAIATDPMVLRRFEREAQTIAVLNHPNIVRILDFQIPSDEPAFLVMERLQGRSLGDTIKDGRRFTVDEVVFIAVQALAGLGAAHAANIIHRDLKPDNVFLTSLPGVNNVVKLLDFGVAKALGTPWNEKLTQTGLVVGTPAYMAPEQARGATVDARADLYAIGCLMYEALTGRAPYSADNYNALICEIVHGTPSPLASHASLDPSFVAIVERAMARDPSARFETAGAMADALTSWTAPRSAPRPPVSSPMTFAPTLMPPAAGRKRRDPPRAKRVR